MITMYPMYTMPVYHSGYPFDGNECAPSELGLNDFTYSEIDTVGYQIPAIETDNNQPAAAAPHNCHDLAMNFPDPALASSPPTDICTYHRPISPSASNQVQQIESQLIKETLKNTIHQKRKHNCSTFAYLMPSKEELPWPNNCCINSISSSSNDSHYGANLLTPEDEEKRTKRRERNKIAATKCRMKKKEKAQILVQEAANQESINNSLKKEIEDLKAERRKLSATLDNHAGQCQFLNELSPHQHQDYYNPSNNTLTVNVNFEYAQFNHESSF